MIAFAIQSRNFSQKMLLDIWKLKLDRYVKKFRDITDTVLSVSQQIGNYLHLNSDYEVDSD